MQVALEWQVPLPEAAAAAAARETLPLVLLAMDNPAALRQPAAVMVEALEMLAVEQRMEQVVLHPAAAAAARLQVELNSPVVMARLAKWF